LNFKLRDADTVFGEKDSDPEIDDRMKTGFTNFLECLNLYLDLQSGISGITSVNESVVHIYKSVTLLINIMANLGLAIYLFV
jgi:hypothetical protein